MPLRLPSRGKLFYGTLGVLGAAAIGYLLVPSARLDARDGPFLRDGEAGFVLTDIEWALGPDAAATGACPSGTTKNVAEIFGESPEGKRQPGEGDEAYSKRLEDGGKAISAGPDGRNYCLHPEIAPVDPHTRMLLSTQALADGIDLDGKISRSSADARSGRLDFAGLKGEKGIDNQLWRSVGCNRSFQSDGQSRGFATEMYTGSWGVLIRLSDVDDLKNDNRVEVGIYANADPIQLSPTREALEYATYAMDQDEDYRATTTGRIVDGVLTTDPVDVRFHKVTNGIYLDRPLRAARIRATLSPRGVLKGYLAGYTPVAALYDYQFGFRNAKDAAGKLAAMARRLGTSNGAARVLGHTCQGIWQSLHRLADGHPDAKTGRFTSISTQYTFEARPAFIVDVDTSSANKALVAK